MPDKYAERAREILEDLWVSTFGVVHADTRNNELVAHALEQAALEARIDEDRLIEKRLEAAHYHAGVVRARLAELRPEQEGKDAKD